jgi:hypothetical protein
MIQWARLRAAPPGVKPIEKVVNRRLACAAVFYISRLLRFSNTGGRSKFFNNSLSPKTGGALEAWGANVEYLRGRLVH